MTYQQLGTVGFDNKLSDESLIYIKNNDAARMDSFGTPKFTSDHEQFSLFNITLCFQRVKKYFTILRGSTEALDHRI